MTYTLDGIVEVFDQLIERLEIELPQISEELATNTMALIINRIQQEGLLGKKYSTQPLPLWYFEDKALNAGGRNALSRKQKKSDRAAIRKGIRSRNGGDDAVSFKGKEEFDEGMSYEEWRRANGLQTNFIDLTFTGRMFQNVQIIGTVRRGNNFITILGATDRENKDKLEWNRNRFGDFFVLHEDDAPIIERLGNDRIEAILNSSKLL